MNPAENIIFIGLSGSGKSSVAALLAHSCRQPLIDCDAAIEQSAGMSIAEIFSTQGEPYFRLLENNLLDRLLKEKQASTLQGHVIACGGGMPVATGNLQKLKLIGRTIYLTATMAEICKRIANENHRPLLASDLADKIAEQHKNRHDIYAMAHMTIDTTTKTQEDVVVEIQRMLTNTTL